MKLKAPVTNPTTLVSSTLQSSASITAPSRTFCSAAASSSSLQFSRVSSSTPSSLSRKSFSTSVATLYGFNDSASGSSKARASLAGGVGDGSRRRKEIATSHSFFTMSSRIVLGTQMGNGTMRSRNLRRSHMAGMLRDQGRSKFSLSNSVSRSINTSSRNQSPELLANQRSSRNEFFKPSFHFGGRHSTSVSAAAPSNQITSSQPQSSDSPSLLSLLLPPKDSNSSTTASLIELYQPRSNDPSLVSPSISSQSSELSNLKAVPRLTPKVTFRLYKQLAKAQLTYLIVLTTMSGYALCPSILSISSSTSIATISVPTLLSLTIGTTLCSSSANAFNQLTEIPYDAQMPRTRNRPLPARNLTPLHAFSFASVTGVLGISTLYYLINPLTAVLGAFNIFLYAGVYTPMKRLSILNTWVGSLVGGIPPLMGWVACTGTLFLPTDLPAWILASLLFAWQFPHFNSLSHAIRSEYARGGYRMTSVLNPDLNKRVSLRYALLCLPICLSLPLTGVVTPIYALLTTPPNLALIHSSWKFWKFGGDKNAKYAFWISIVHLPAVLLLAMACKTELWEAVMAWWNGEEEEGNEGKAEKAEKVEVANRIIEK